MSTQDRAPAFPFYAKDWLADPKVRALSWADKGRYIDLLASMWEHNDSGCSIPRVTAEAIFGSVFISKVCDLPSRLLESYEVEGEVWVFSNRLSQEAQKCRSRSEAARLSVSKRKDRRGLRT